MDINGLIRENTIKNHEFEHARHYHGGIDEYPLARFRVEDGRVNGLLFGAVSELFAYKSEADGLRSIKRLQRGYVQQVIPGLLREARIYYGWLFDARVTKGTDPELVKELREKLDLTRFIGS